MILYVDNLETLNYRIYNIIRRYVNKLFENKIPVFHGITLLRKKDGTA